MRSGVVAVVAAWFVSLPALAQVSGQFGSNNPINANPINTNTNTANPRADSNAASTSRGGAASANPNASANPSATGMASSGSSSVAVTTGNQSTTYPANQTVVTVPMVYTPSVATGNVCALGASGGASWLGAGFAFGASWESMQCERRQTAALLWNMNTPESRMAAKEVLCNTPEIREAYARSGAPCTVDLTRVAGPALPQQQPRIAPQQTVASFDPAPYRSAADCLTAAQAAGSPLSVCAGKR